MFDIYNMAGRITYGDFVAAAENTIRALIARKADVLMGYPVNVNTNGGETALVYRQYVNQYSYSGTCFFVCLPTVPLDQKVSADFARATLAFIIHELMHVVATDLDAPQQGPAASLMNILEDHHIERLASDPDHPIADNASADIRRTKR
ncbi:MAG: hypothetical protein U5N55_02195 [Cypionkella sp.]|nr:hypothetical protein [Cypionkella sp.]